MTTKQQRGTNREGHKEGMKLPTMSGQPERLTCGNSLNRPEAKRDFLHNTKKKMQYESLAKIHVIIESS
jgi:hypothetical protein